MKLSTFRNKNFNRGRPLVIQILWYLIGSAVVRTRWIPLYSARRAILRLFGATIGMNVVIKSGVRVTFPWRLSIGDDSWVGEDVWIDNLAPVSIGTNCCISQGAYLCTGNHDWSSTDFALKVAPITIEEGAWICARAIIAPGTVIQNLAVVSIGSVAKGTVEAGWLYSGNPAEKVRKRKVSTTLTKPSLLFLNDSYPPDIAASGQYLAELALAASMNGHPVTILCASREAESFPPFYSPPTNPHDTVEVQRAPRIFKRGGGKFYRLIANFYSISYSAFYLVTCTRPDRIVCLSSPPLAYIVVIFLAGLRRIPVSLWILDINPDQAIASGWLSTGGLLHRAVAVLNAWALQKADQIVTLDQEMCHRLETNGAPPANLSVHPLWAPAVIPMGMESQLHKPDIFTVMYAGNLSMCHPLTTLLEAAEQLQSDPFIQFRIVGNGPQLRTIVQQISEKQIRNISLEPAVPYAELPRLLSEADLHIVSFGDDFRGIVHPSKPLAIAKARRPFILIGDPSSSYCQSWSKYPFAICIPHGDKTSLVNQICTFKDSQTNSDLSISFDSFQEDFPTDRMIAATLNSLTPQHCNLGSISLQSNPDTV